MAGFLSNTIACLTFFNILSVTCLFLAPFISITFAQATDKLAISSVFAFQMILLSLLRMSSCWFTVCFDEDIGSPGDLACRRYVVLVTVEIFTLSPHSGSHSGGGLVIDIDLTAIAASL